MRTSLYRFLSKFGIKLGRVLNMPNADLALWASHAWLNPPGGGIGPVIASTTTIAPTNPVHHVSGTSAITTITLPFTGFTGRITLIADAAFTMATGGTAGADISTAVTMVAGQFVDVLYDGTIWTPGIAD